jgi:tRNA-dihydrouridine synthase
MIGRAALGAPWLLGEIADPEHRAPGVDERWRIILEHVAALHEFYGEPGVRIARKHVQWYLGRLPAPASGELDARAAGAEFNRLVDPTAQLDLLASLRERWCPVRRAA